MAQSLLTRFTCLNDKHYMNCQIQPYECSKCLQDICEKQEDRTLALISNERDNVGEDIFQHQRFMAFRN